eukprot:699625-Lingulodinium_polyedra.AAC.1
MVVSAAAIAAPAAQPPVKAPPPLPEWAVWPPAPSTPAPAPAMSDALIQKLRPFAFSNAQR